MEINYEHNHEIVPHEPGFGKNHGSDEIHFSVDGEPEHIAFPQLTANTIIEKYGKKDPKTHYLVQIRDKKRVSYKDRGEELVAIIECANFQIISTGPTPVSDGKIRTGTEVFIEGLKSMGYSPTSLPNKPDHLFFDYEVPVGKFMGQKIRLGFVVPSDFPLTAPSGPYVSPHIHPINVSGAHPNGAIHHTQAAPFEQDAKGAWQYWSRPCLEWSAGKKTVPVYMSHIWRLWDSQ